MSTQSNGVPTGCPYEMWDGAYVLGSLSPAERREYEAHLDGCEACSLAVRDLAGLPGLLGRIGPEVLDEREVEPVPETLLPRLSRAVRRRQQRRTWLTAGIAAAAAVVVTSAGIVTYDHESSTPRTNTSSPLVLSKSQLMPPAEAHDPMVARVALTSVPWGTRLDLTCTYPRDLVSYQSGAYALVVHTKDGRSERVATWHGLTGMSMHVTGATSAWKDQISSVEVTTLQGATVAQLNL